MFFPKNYHILRSLTFPTLNNMNILQKAAQRVQRQFSKSSPAPSSAQSQLQSAASNLSSTSPASSPTPPSSSSSRRRRRSSPASSPVRQPEPEPEPEPEPKPEPKPEKQIIVTSFTTDLKTGIVTDQLKGVDFSLEDKKTISRLTRDHGRLSASITDDEVQFFATKPLPQTPTSTQPSLTPYDESRTKTYTDTLRDDLTSRGVLAPTPWTSIISPRVQDIITKSRDKPDYALAFTPEALAKSREQVLSPRRMTEEQKPLDWGIRTHAVTSQPSQKIDTTRGLFDTLFSPLSPSKSLVSYDPSVLRGSISTDNLIETQDFSLAYPLPKKTIQPKISGEISLDKGDFVAAKPSVLYRLGQKSEELFDPQAKQTYSEIGLSLGATAGLILVGAGREAVRTVKAFTVNLPETIVGFESLVTGRTKFSDMQLVDPSLGTAEKLGAISFQAVSSSVSAGAITRAVSRFRTRLSPSPLSSSPDMFTSVNWKQSPIRVISKEVAKKQDTLQLDLFGRVIPDDQVYKLASPDVLVAKRSPLGLPKSYYDDLLRSSRPSPSKGSRIVLDENIGVQAYSFTEGGGQLVLTDFRAVGPKTKPFTPPITARVVDRLSGVESDVFLRDIPRKLADKPSLSVIGQTPRRLFALDPITFTVMETRKRLLEFKPKFIESQVKLVDDINIFSKTKFFSRTKIVGSDLSMALGVLPLFKSGVESSLAVDSVFSLDSVQKVDVDSVFSLDSVQKVDVDSVFSLDSVQKVDVDSALLISSPVSPKPLKPTKTVLLKDQKEPLIKPIIPFFPSKKSSSKKTKPEYVAQAGNPLGKYYKTFKAEKLKGAVKKAKKYVDNTPAASLSITKNNLPLPEDKRLVVKRKLGKNYTRSVIDPNTFVEKREKRITTGGEKRLLQLDKVLGGKNNLRAVKNGMSLRNIRRMIR